MRKVILSLTLISIMGLASAQEAINTKQITSVVNAYRLEKKYYLADSIAQNYISNHLLKMAKRRLMTRENLQFILDNLQSTESSAFDFLFKNRNKTNKVLGVNKAEYALKNAIVSDFIPQEVTWEKIEPDFEKLEKLVTNRFGSLGREVVCGKRMLFYIKVKDWSNFGKYYTQYFKLALQRPDYNVNDCSWYVFENVSDSNVVEFACNVVMRYAMNEWYKSDANAFDTYAQLLYKSGKATEAIQWEERALIIAGDIPQLKKQSTHALEKMKLGLPTWKIIQN